MAGSGGAINPPVRGAPQGFTLAARLFALSEPGGSADDVVLNCPLFYMQKLDRSVLCWFSVESNERSHFLLRIL